MTIKINRFPESLLGKWIAEDVQDEPEKGPVYTVSCFMKNPDGSLRSFNFIQYEEPPLMISTPIVSSSAIMENTIILKETDENHPLQFASAAAIQRAMTKLVFDPKGEFEVK